MVIEIVKFILYSVLIVLISKYILVTTLRKLAESLNLNAKIVGNITGYATSVPELLTIITSSSRGLTNTSIYNILSSNIINLIQYLGTIILNKNVKRLRNRAIQIDLVLVIITILLPILLLKFNIEMKLTIVPIFIVLYVLFNFINGKVHNLYLQKEDEKIELELENEKKLENVNKNKSIRYVFGLILIGIALFVVGELLGQTLENLCKLFNVPEILIGIFLGFITSLPELITFFESQKYHSKLEDDMLGVVESTNNLLTSNIVNIFIIQTIGIMIK